MKLDMKKVVINTIPTSARTVEKLRSDDIIMVFEDDKLIGSITVSKDGWYIARGVEKIGLKYHHLISSCAKEALTIGYTVKAHYAHAPLGDMETIYPVIKDNEISLDDVPDEDTLVVYNGDILEGTIVYYPDQGWFLSKGYTRKCHNTNKKGLIKILIGDGYDVYTIVE